MSRLLLFVFFSICTCLVIYLGLKSFFTSSLFPAPSADIGDVPEGWHELVLPQSKCVVWLYRSVDRQPIVLYFHGNGEDLGTLKRGGFLNTLTELGTVAVLDYPGYGRSAAKPSPSKMIASANELVAAIRELFPGRPIIALGWSLGAAVAAQLDDVDHLVLVSAWSTLRKVSADHFPAWLVPLIVPRCLESVSAITGANSVLFVHGENDPVVPVYHGRLMADAVNVEPLIVEGAGHDVLLDPLAWQAIRTFVSHLSNSP